MNKTLTVLFPCAAVIAASLAAYKYMAVKEAETAAAVAKAQSAEALAESEAKKARSQEAAALANEKAKASEAKSAEENRKAAEIKLEEQKIAADRAKSEADAMRDKAAAADAEARKASEYKAAEKLKADAAKAAAREARLKAESDAAKAASEAQSAEAKLAAEKLKSEAKIAEAKVLELRKIDFETIERNLIEYQQELEERERALTPDKTSADMTWVEEREADSLGGTNTVRRKLKTLPENNTSLPIGERVLERVKRLDLEAQSEHAGINRTRVVASLEALYLQAISEQRVNDAHFYYTALKSLYPDWEYSPKKEVETK